MTTTSKLLQAVIAQSLGRVLPPIGYSVSPAEFRHPNSAAQYHQSFEDHLRIVDVQRDKRWSKQVGHFTINVGVYIPSVEAALGRSHSFAVAHTGFATVTERLGILSDGFDKWWKVTPHTEVAPTANEIVKNWEIHGLPWLNARGGLQPFRDTYLARNNFLFAFIASRLLGDHVAARSQFIQYLLHRQPAPDDPALRYALHEDIVPCDIVPALKRAIIQDRATARRLILDMFPDAADLRLQLDD
jgi:hypothetical protein